MNYKQSAYGITDKLVDFYVPIAIFCAIATSAVLIISTHMPWYVVLIIAPFAAWGGPFAILIPIYFLECACYGLLHPKETLIIIYYFLLLIAFLFGSAIIALGIVRFCATHIATPDPSRWEFAYISESPNAHCYHYSEQCEALSRTTYNIEMTSVEEAEIDGYEPCGICLKKSVRKQWDEAGYLLFIPVACLLKQLLSKIGHIRKKYKLRNPIVKR